jgi:S1-C subfamily serine protease
MRHRTLPAALAGLAVVTAAIAALTLRADGLDPRLKEAEAKRIAAIEKVRPAVVAIFAPGGQGGGSGVLISDDGYALTNYHVVEGPGSVMQCGLPDGVLYDAVLVGLDKVGDVALIKLLPKKEGAKFPFAAMGDSDKVRAGDWSLAMGNPFLLATDFTPTVTYGMISGVHRYQYPAGTLLEYTDCIQVDTSINPGNSGGPLFNMDGELIGINGRISLEKRGRVNVGVGYSISINQIKNFMGQLRAGLETDHASLGALFQTEAEEEELAKVVVTNIIDSDARRRGLDIGDQLVSFAGRPMSNVNQFKNVLGLFPKGWRVPLVYRRENGKTMEKHEILVRLMGVQRQELPGADGQQPPPGQPQPPRRPQPQRPAGKPSPALKFFEAKEGYANYYFNKQARDRLLADFKKQSGDFSAVKGDWSLRAGGFIKGKRAASVITVRDKGAKDGKSPLIQGIIDAVEYGLEPLDPGQSANALKDPPGSGGLLLALYHYRQFLAFGEKGGFREFSHGGVEPFYLPPPEKGTPDYAKLRTDAEVLRTELTGVPAKWYFSAKDHTLLGFELSPDREEDPCEVYFSDYRTLDGRSLPHRIEVRYADKQYALMEVNAWKLDAAK